MRSQSRTAIKSTHWKTGYKPLKMKSRANGALKSQVSKSEKMVHIYKANISTAKSYEGRKDDILCMYLFRNLNKGLK